MITEASSLSINGIMRFCLLLPAMMLANSFVAQNSGALKGKVLIEDGAGTLDGNAAGAGEPEYIGLPGAYVRWAHEASSMTVTDGFGYFKLSGAQIGDTLFASMLGYNTAAWI